MKAFPFQLTILNSKNAPYFDPDIFIDSFEEVTSVIVDKDFTYRYEWNQIPSRINFHFKDENDRNLIQLLYSGDYPTRAKNHAR